MELLPFVDILKVFNNPINEEQAWAVCYQSAYFLYRNPTQEFFQDVYDSGILSIWLSRHGDVFIRKGPQEPNGSGKGPPLTPLPSPSSKHAPANIFKPKRSVIATETDAVQALGTAIFEALDFGIEVTEERQLSPGLETLIVAMTLADSSIDAEYEAQNADDEGIEKDSDVEHRCSVSEVLKMCSQHLSSKQDAHHHFKAVCRALATEAGELFTFLDKISSGREKLSETADEDSKRLDELQRADWACLWVQVMRSLRQGVLLKKIEHVHHPPLEYELTPFEMLLEDIKSRRYTLHKIMVNGEIPRQVKDDAQLVILNFIRSRPPLRKVDDRKLKPKPPSPPDPHEELLRDIRAQPKLRPVRQGKLVVETSRTRLNEEDELEAALPVKRVIKADLNLLLSSSFEESSDEDDNLVTSMSTPFSVSTSPSPPQQASSSATASILTDSCASSQVKWRRAATKDTLMNESGAHRPSKLQRRHTIMVCESPVDGKVLSGELPPLTEEENEPSPIKESHSMSSFHSSGSRPNPSHPLVPKSSFSDHDLQSQVILRHPPGQTRRLSLEHRRSLTSLPMGLSVIPEMEDAGNGGAEGSPSSARPSNLFRRSWSSEQAPPPNPSPPCKARVRTSVSMSMAGSRPRSCVSHYVNALQQQQQQQPVPVRTSSSSASAPAATATSQPVTNASCMPSTDAGISNRPPSFFSHASFNLKNSENDSSRHASRGPIPLTRHSSLPLSQHASANLRSSFASSVTFPSSSPSSSLLSSSSSQEPRPLCSTSSSSSSSTSSSSSSSSSSTFKSSPRDSTAGVSTESTHSNLGSCEKLDIDASSQSPFFSRSLSRLATSTTQEQEASENNSSPHTVIEPTAQRQSQGRWRNSNAREERQMRRQFKSGIAGITPPSGIGIGLHEGDSSSVQSLDANPNPNPNQEHSEHSEHSDSIDGARPRRLSLDGGVNLYTDATNGSVKAPVGSLGGVKTSLAAVGRRSSLGGAKSTAERNQRFKSPEEEEKLSRWRVLQGDDLEERIKTKLPSAAGYDSISFQSLLVAIPDEADEEDEYPQQQQHSRPQRPSTTHNQTSLSSQEQQHQSLQPAAPASSTAVSPRTGRFFKSNQSRISPSGQRLICESPDVLKQHMATEEARLARWRLLEENTAAELDFVSGDLDSGESPLDSPDPNSSSSSSCNPPASPGTDSDSNPNPAPLSLADKLNQGKAMLPKRWENPIECLSLTLEEVTHIRSVLTKVELESLISHPDLYQQVAKNKLCFTCKTVRFSLFGEWGSKCKFCRRMVCSKCLRKMNVPTDHFRNIPVYTLSPTPLSTEMQEFIQTYIRKAPPSSVPATRDASPCRNNHHNQQQQQPSLSSITDSVQSPASATNSQSTTNKAPSEEVEPSTAKSNSGSTRTGSSRSFFNKSASKPLQRSQSAMSSNAATGGVRASMKGPLMAICCDCKGMVMEIIRASRTSLALIMTPGASNLSPPHPSKSSNRMFSASQSFRY